MQNRKKNIEDFIETYELSFNKALSSESDNAIEAITNLFSECFIESSPQNVCCGKQGDLTRRIKKNLEQYRNSGVKEIAISSMEINLLEDFHAIVKVTWRSTVRKENASEEIVFETIYYFLRTVKNSIRMFGYITGSDQKEWEEHAVKEEEQQQEMVYDL
jgi:hypothetical protein